MKRRENNSPVTKAIQVENLSFSFGDLKVLRELTFDVPKGELFAILGPNGSGKTTLLKCLARIHDGHSGKIILGKKNLLYHSYRQLAQVQGYVPQTLFQAAGFTAEDCVLMGRSPYLKRLQSESKEDFRIVHRSMEQVETLHLKKRLLSELSGGELQRVMIARALAQQPDVLLLDEPVSHLDIRHQYDVLSILKDFTETQGQTAVIILHDINYALQAADRIMVLNCGEIAATGVPAEILENGILEEVYRIRFEKIPAKYSTIPYLMPVQ